MSNCWYLGPTTTKDVKGVCRSTARVRVKDLTDATLPSSSSTPAIVSSQNATDSAIKRVPLRTVLDAPRADSQPTESQERDCMEGMAESKEVNRETDANITSFNDRSLREREPYKERRQSGCTVRTLH